MIAERSHQVRDVEGYRTDQQFDSEGTGAAGAWSSGSGGTGAQDTKVQGARAMEVREHGCQQCRHGQVSSRTLVPFRVRVTIRVRELHYHALKIIRQRLQQRLLFKFRRVSEEAEKLPMMTE